MTDFIKFPNDFEWGAATASYQIEGAAHADGRSNSIWDVFSRTPGKILNGDTGDMACDHYHRWKEDVALMKEIGLKAYRFSIAWPRILPDGRGKINKAGIDFYSRLIDELLKSNIHPLVTLFHWDLPASLLDGWLNRATSDAFVEYVGVVVHAFGDRVKDWITLNEPFCSSYLSYNAGVHAPGLRDTSKALIAVHHLLLAHGKAVPVIRENCPNAKVGIVLNLSPFHPASQTEADRSAARHLDGELNRMFLDPLFGRNYPADMVADYIKMDALKTSKPEFIREDDMAKIAVPTDFLGINYYFPTTVRGNEGPVVDPSRFARIPAPKEKQTAMGWEVNPDGFHEIVMRIHREYKPAKILITENGASYPDRPDAGGEVHDVNRIEYLRGHIGAIGRAIRDGAPVEGYYVWSLLDNFEWSFGYSQRFGIVYVDYSTQKRYPKDSAFWYQKVIESNGSNLSL